MPVRVLGARSALGSVLRSWTWGSFSSPAALWGGWRGGVLGMGCWKPALARRFLELYPRIGVDRYFSSQL